MGVSPVTTKAIQIFAFVTEEELKGDSPALTIYDEQFAVMRQKLPLDFRSGVKQGAGHRHRGPSPRPFRISFEKGHGCGVRLGSTVRGHKQETSSKLGRAADQIASEFRLCVKKFLAIAS